MWKVTYVDKLPKLRKPVLIEGLPGIGNVGKVAVDFLVDELKAKKIAEFESYSFPHSVFVNEENLIELPTIELYAKQMKGLSFDLLLLAGDVQPIDEVSCYEFCDTLLTVSNKFKVSEIVTLGGIGLQKIPEEPKVFCTSWHKKCVAPYKKAGIDTNLYGIVGPIVGVSGVLLGLAGKDEINAVSLLAETLGHPMYLGVKGATELLNVLKKRLKLKIDLRKMEKEIVQLEKEVLRKTKELSDVSTKSAMNKLKGKMKKETGYIG